MLKKGANVRAWRKFAILTDCFAALGPGEAKEAESGPSRNIRKAVPPVLRTLALHANTPFHGKDDQHCWLVVGSLRRP